MLLAYMLAMQIVPDLKLPKKNWADCNYQLKVNKM